MRGDYFCMYVLYVYFVYTYIYIEKRLVLQKLECSIFAMLETVLTSMGDTRTRQRLFFPAQAKRLLRYFMSFVSRCSTLRLGSPRLSKIAACSTAPGAAEEEKVGWGWRWEWDWC